MTVPPLPDKSGQGVVPAPLFYGVRGTAVKLLNRVERTDSYLDKLLDIELRSPDMSDVDKGLLSELVHGVLRWQNRLDWVLNGFSHGNFSKSETNVKNALRVALYQVMFLDRVPHAAAVNEAVEFIKRVRGEKPAGLVNAVLRNIIRNLEGIRYPDRAEDEVQYLAVFLSHPHWLVKRWARRFGLKETEALLNANNKRPELSLRVNRLKTDTAGFIRMLEEQGITPTPSRVLDSYLRVKGLARIGQMELFRSGMFTIQDESAALPSMLLSPRPGERVLDLCAAPGGKTTHLAELLDGKGEVVALDRYEAKLNLIRASCERLGLKNVTFRVGDALVVEDEGAERVLLDAPCSGLGVLGKKPDMKWKRDYGDILKLAKIQADLLDRAAGVVKPGGVLVYSTCTTEPEENRDVVKHFLDTHPEFEQENASRFVHPDLVSPDGCVETFPHRHFMDGTFAVRLIRKEAPAK
ncbi:MAG: 16S rRNA (cytosine(967)-C(5))-methyltransferase RsmB [Bacteroidota bacterium]